MDRRNTIESLRQELNRLTLASSNILRAIEDLERRELPGQPDPREIQITDRDGTPIKIGDRVIFLTKGKFKSTSGTVTRFSRNKERVYATDSNKKEISRAPRNVRII